MTVLRKSFYIHWSAGRSPRVHEVNPGRDPSALVDPGATHSFISVPFTERHQIESQPIDGRMVVSVPNGDTMISERIVPSSRLVI